MENKDHVDFEHFEAELERSLTRIILLLQDAQRKELDLRAPVQKQRAKKFNLEEELEKRELKKKYATSMLYRLKKRYPLHFLLFPEPK